MNFKKATKLPLFFIALMFITGIIAYPYLSGSIPIHWNMSGKIDSWAAKSILSVFMAPLLCSILYVLFLLMPLIDPLKKNYKKFVKAYNLMIEFVVGFFTFMFAVSLIASAYKNFHPEIAINIGVGILFIVLGNQLPTIRRNWFFGIKLPWTLANETVWNKTHRFGAKIFIITGLIMIFGSFLPGPFNQWAIISAYIFMGISLVLYSYLEFHKLEKTDKNSSAC